MIIQYVREKNRAPRGVVVAEIQGDKVVVGWSYTNIKAGDRFDKKRGLTIALGRSANGSNVRIPERVLPIITSVMSRAVKYYKGLPVATC